jgi:predicted ATPase/class 3 adenylate cyclase/DNA-binding CsgD family transcriptional regulator
MTATRDTEGDFVLPVGTVTLLLADVEGSTRLWENEPEQMSAAIARLDEVVNDIVGRNGGVRPVEQGEGDSFVAAFARASDAVSAALALQLTDLTPIRLRVGIHTGEVQLRDEGNYVGSAVNRCARVRNLGHGGQTLVSGATHDLVIDRLPEGASLDDLGVHRLRDLARPERVYQLCHAGLQADFPALRSLDAFPHNLPVQLTTFVGRRAELDTVSALIEAERLVTLVGAGGCGKTRLALQVAADALGDYPDGVWVAELAPITDADVVGSVVMRALGLQDEPYRSPAESIAHHVGSKTLMVVLDNCEHVVAAAAALADHVLRACPSVTILATSREPVGVSGEVTWRVPSLSLPGDTGAAAIDAVTASEAVQLFVERAQRARPDFVLTDANASTVAEICQRLDGIPLAIELAAARVRAFAPDRILAGLEDCFQLLAGGARTAMPRQQTLRASVQWSFDLLSEPERTLFRRLSVFAGDFDIDAAEATCAGVGLDAHHVVDQLALLIDKSLVQVEDGVAETRYRLLETVRQYAAEQLDAAGEADDVRRAHRDHYRDLVSELFMLFEGQEQDRSADRLVRELDNLRAAFQWSCAVGDYADAVTMASETVFVWNARGLSREGTVWGEAVYAAAESLPTELKVRARIAVANSRGVAFDPSAITVSLEAVALAREVGDDKLLSFALATAGNFLTLMRQDAEPVLREGLALARAIGDDFVITQNLMNLSFTLLWSDGVAARAFAEEALASAKDAHMARSARHFFGQVLLAQGDNEAAVVENRKVAAVSGGDRLRVVTALANQGAALAQMGRPEEARACLDESIAVAHDAGLAVWAALPTMFMSPVGLAGGDLDDARAHMRDGFALSTLFPGVKQLHLAGWAALELAAGNVDEAQRLADDAVAQAAEPRLEWILALATCVRARVAVIAGDLERAEDLLYAALPLWRQTLGKQYTAETLELLATVVRVQESYHEAARLIGAADSLRALTGFVRYVVYQPLHDETVASLRAALGDADYDAAFAEGAALSFDEAITYALRGRGERKRPSFGWASLTPAELDVVRLVADGLSNKEIAAKLFVSPRTVQTHLTHVYAKVDVTSRVQLARAAADRAR